jgi:hypothetical protein
MPTEPANNTVFIDQALLQIQRHCLLVTLHVKAWVGQPTIDEANVTVDGEELDDDKATSPHWRLMPNNWKTKFKTLESRARTLIREHSVPFRLRGVHVVPITMAENLFAQLRVLKEQYEITTKMFIDSYGEWTKQLKDKLGELAIKHVPLKHKLYKKFAMEWAIVPMGQPGDTIDDFEMSDLVREARDTMGKLIMESVETMITQPKQELAEAVQNLVDMIENNEKVAVRSASLDKLQKTFNKYRSFASFIDSDGRIVEMLNKVDKTMDGVSPKMINRDEDIRDGLLTALKALNKEVAEESKTLASFDKFKRAINI